MNPFAATKVADKITVEDGYVAEMVEYEGGSLEYVRRSPVIVSRGGSNELYFEYLKSRLVVFVGDLGTPPPIPPTGSAPSPGGRIPQVLSRG